MLPLFKKSHIHSRHIEDLLKRGNIPEEYGDENNKRNALRQASMLYRIVDNELFRHGTEREYQKYGLRMVVHDDEPEKKAEIIAKCHLDQMGNHLGMNNTIKDVCDTYYWQGISAHVKMYLKQCEKCKTRSKFSAEEWLELERKNIDKKKALTQISAEAQKELKSLGRVKRPTPPETFFIVNAERKVNLDSGDAEPEMMIDSNNIEYVVETLGQSDGLDLEEVCHVLNVPDILPVPERFRSREIETFLRDGTYPSDFTSNMKCGLRGPAAQYKIIEDELYHEGNKVGNKGLRLVIHDDLPALKIKVIVECHIDDDGSHHGLNKTLNRISEKYYWTGMSVDVRKFMMHCKICSESRGRRYLHDGKEYEQEAQEVKSRHMKKMNESEASGSGQLGTDPVSYDSTDIEPTEDFEQEGHQVIRLIGPNKEVTEITVAVVNQETVTADNAESHKTLKEGENNDQFNLIAGAVSKGQSLVTKEMTDAVAQIEAAEAAMELAEFKNKQNIKVEEAMTDGDVENLDNTVDPEIIVKKELCENNENIEIEASQMKNGQTDENETTVVNKDEMTEVEGEMTEIETEDGVVSVLIIKDGENGQQVEGVSSTVDGDNRDFCRIELTGEQSFQEVVGQNRINIMDSLVSGTYYNNVIFVPSLLKTRIIENFLKLGVAAEGFSHAKLLEMSENFEIVDDVLYRRPSRYKGRQIVIHDDTPELKLKFISELHVKRNGTHSSEVITLQNVSFKYFWEEMKWDIHRWYPTCKMCVNEDGIERRSNKKILSVEEQKVWLEQKRRENRLSGASALSSRSFRNKMKSKLQELKFGNAHTQSQIFTMTESDIKKMGGIEIKGFHSKGTSEYELSVPGSSTEDKSDAVKVGKKNNWNVLYDLMIYATIKQEQSIKEMYLKKGWKYSLKSIKKARDEDIFDVDEDYYLLELKVTSIQEAAITELFKSMGLAIESGDVSNSTNSSSPEKNNVSNDQSMEPAEATDDQTMEPAETSDDQALEPAEATDSQTMEPVEKTDEKTMEPAEKEQKEVSNVNEGDKGTEKECSPVKQSKSVVCVDLQKVQVANEIAPKINKIDISKQKNYAVLSTKQSRDNDIPVQRAVPSIRRVNILSKSPTKAATAGTDAGQSHVKTGSMKNTVIYSPVKTVPKTSNSESSNDKTINAGPQSTPTVDKSGIKRKIDETPVSESRRPRREIKKPRRFSPDSSPAPKPVIIKIEPQRTESDEEKYIDSSDKTEVHETPKLSRRKGKEQARVITVVESKTDSSPVTPAVDRNTRSSQSVTTDTTKSSKQKEQNEKVETLKYSKAIEAAQARISVMSKGRIRVKKLPKEINSGQIKSLNISESNTEKVEELNKIVINSEENSQTDTDDDVTNIIDELDHDDEDDDEEMDDEDDLDDDDDDDDEMDIDEDEAGSMKIPLHVILDDALENAKPIELDKGFSCSHCDARFPSKQKCIQHCEKNNCIKECELCGVIFKKIDQSQFKNHADQHKKSKKFPCKVCKKSFFSDEHLKIHTRVHNNEVMKKCDQCETDFYTWFQYAAHMVCKHEECNMFTCDVCNAKFASINFMKSEIRFDGMLSYFRCIMCDN